MKNLLFYKKFVLSLFCLILYDGLTAQVALPTQLNEYAGVTDYNPCNPDGAESSWIEVDDPTGFNVGDSILIIQMKGATVLTNQGSYGALSDPKSSGLCELQKIRSISGQRFYLYNEMVNRYDKPTYGSVQVVKIFYAVNAVTTGPITCPAWNGTEGGVIYLSVSGYLHLQHTISANGKGFRPGTLSLTGGYVCNNISLLGPMNDPLLGHKGEGIASILTTPWPAASAVSSGRGAYANGGGGGNDHNSGGGGGGNYGAGGFGGYQFNLCGPPPSDNRGVGGKSITAGRLYFGGGGGAGHGNNHTRAGGARGGGIVIVNANYLLVSNMFTAITAVGANAPQVWDDGAGGGGGGGTVAVCVQQQVGFAVALSTHGGNGGNVRDPGYSFGPGGGGGGGYIYHNLTNYSIGIMGTNCGSDRVSTSPNGATSGGQELVTYTCYNIPRGWTSYCDLDDIDMHFCRNETKEVCIEVCDDIDYIEVEGHQQSYIVPPSRIVCFEHTAGVVDETLQIKLFKIAPYGTACEADISFNVIIDQPIETVINLSITCGDAIDLNDYDNCNGFPFYWEDLTNGLGLISSIVSPTSNTTYRLYSYEQPDYVCLNCIVTVNVVVNPIPINVINVAACESESVDLNIPNPCGGSGTYTWQPPTGPDILTTTPSLGITAHDGDQYVVSTILPNGCACTTLFVISTTVPTIHHITRDIVCGDAVNLNDYDLCNGFDLGWEDLTNLSILVSPIVTPTSNNVYKLTSYANSSMSCLNCIVLLTVNVLPMPVYTREVFACEGESVVLSPNEHCLPGLGYSWEGPGFLPYSSITPDQVFTAHNGDEYLVVVNLPNGCICSTEIIVRTEPRILTTNVETVVCGTQVNLNDYGLGCDGGAYSVWYDEQGLPVSDPSAVIINGELEFTKKTFSAGGCVECIVVVRFVPTDPEPYERVLQVGCGGGDGVLLTPIFCTNGISEYFDQLGNSLGLGPVFISRARDGEVIRIEGVDENGCPCVELVTIEALPIVTNEIVKEVEVECGEEIIFSEHGSCPLTNGYWRNSGSGLEIPTGTYTVRDIDNGTFFYREYIDPVTCERCLEIIKPVMSPSATIVDYPEPLYFCSSGTFEPDDCDENVASYKWLDENEEFIVSTQKGIAISPALNGTRTRYSYDANGCLLCIDRYILTWRDPVSQDDIDNMPFTDGFVFSECETGCIQFNMTYQLPQYTPSISCTWSPFDIEIPGDKYEICPPWSQYVGTSFVRKCVNQDGCVIDVAKVFFMGTTCPPEEFQKHEPSSIADALDQEVNVVPNPNNGVFYLESTNRIDESSVVMYDALGKAVEIQVERINGNRVEIRLRNFADGIYFIHVLEQSTTRSFKVVVLK